MEWIKTKDEVPPLKKKVLAKDQHGVVVECYRIEFPLPWTTMVRWKENLHDHGGFGIEEWRPVED